MSACVNDSSGQLTVLHPRGGPQSLAQERMMSLAGGRCACIVRDGAGPMDGTKERRLVRSPVLYSTVRASAMRWQAAAATHAR